MKKVYILTRNGQVEHASKDVKILWVIMGNLLAALGKPAPPSYVTITRNVNEHGTFIHSWAPGQSFEIITRDLLYTRRARRKRHEDNAKTELKNQMPASAAKYGNTPENLSKIVVTEGVNSRDTATSAG